jgi:hypothetical protein
MNGSGPSAGPVSITFRNGFVCFFPCREGAAFLVARMLRFDNIDDAARQEQGWR